MSKARIRVLFVVTAILLFGMSQNLPAEFRGPRDPGVRADPKGGPAAAGGPIGGLSGPEGQMFTQGQDDFESAETVADGVGPRFNFVSCGGCHAQPATGGTSPAVNPLFTLTALGFKNVFPSFITPDGPVREARFQFNPDGSRDGGVHAIFTIAGHKDAPGCNIRQEDFETQVRNRNIIFRIPTPVFGAGLIENFTDTTILNNLNANSNTKRSLGISGRANRNGNDGRISRFGWKAQNPSLLVFSGEAYNVEMGITNEAFPIERDETPSCQFAKTPNDVTPSTTVLPAIVNFANFQRFLAPPAAVASYNGVSAASVARGKQQFSNVGCALCHTPSLSTNGNTTVAGRPCVTRPPFSTPTWPCTRWARVSPTTSSRARLEVTSSGPHRCGASDSVSSSCTMVGPTTSTPRSRPTPAAATRSSGRRRRMGSSTTTIA